MEVKSICITGHTAGIGQGLYNYYQSKNITTLGFSRATGADISDPAVVDKIIALSQRSNVFINNAYSGPAQTTLAQKWFDLHQNKNHLLVNISSIAPAADPYIPDNMKYESYTQDKIQLEKIGWEINFAGKSAKCITICPGLVDTAFGHPGYYEQFKQQGKLISVDEVTPIIVAAIEQYNDRWFIPQLHIINNTNFS